MLVHCLAFGMCFFFGTVKSITQNDDRNLCLLQFFNSTDDWFWLFIWFTTFVCTSEICARSCHKSSDKRQQHFANDLIIQSGISNWGRIFITILSFLLLVLFIAVCTFIKYLIWSWTELRLNKEWKCDEQIEKWDENVMLPHAAVLVDAMKSIFPMIGLAKGK